VRVAAAAAGGALVLQLLAATRASSPTCETSSLPVYILIPALNEELALPHTLRSLACLRPPPAGVFVAPGPSSDSTAALARRAGATVVPGGRGRVRRRPSSRGLCSRALPRRPR